MRHVAFLRLVDTKEKNALSQELMDLVLRKEYDFILNLYCDDIYELQLAKEETDSVQTLGAFTVRERMIKSSVDFIIDYKKDKNLVPAGITSQKTILPALVYSVILNVEQQKEEGTDSVVNIFEPLFVFEGSKLIFSTTTIPIPPKYEGMAKIEQYLSIAGGREYVQNDTQISLGIMSPDLIEIVDFGDVEQILSRPEGFTPPEIFDFEKTDLEADGYLYMSIFQYPRSTNEDETYFYATLVDIKVPVNTNYDLTDEGFFKITDSKLVTEKAGRMTILDAFKNEELSGYEKTVLEFFSFDRAVFLQTLMIDKKLKTHYLNPNEAGEENFIKAFGYTMDDLEILTPMSFATKILSCPAFIEMAYEAEVKTTLDELIGEERTEKFLTWVDGFIEKASDFSIVQQINETTLDLEFDEQEGFLSTSFIKMSDDAYSEGEMLRFKDSAAHKMQMANIGLSEGVEVGVDMLSGVLDDGDFKQLIKYLIPAMSVIVVQGTIMILYPYHYLPAIQEYDPQDDDLSISDVKAISNDILPVHWLDLSDMISDLAIETGDDLLDLEVETGHVGGALDLESIQKSLTIVDVPIVSVSYKKTHLRVSEIHQMVSLFNSNFDLDFKTVIGGIVHLIRHIKVDDLEKLKNFINNYLNQLINSQRTSGSVLIEDLLVNEQNEFIIKMIGHDFVSLPGVEMMDSLNKMHVDFLSV